MGGHEFASIDAGSTQTCALTTDGAAYCWGGSGLGDGVDRRGRPAREPVAVAGGHRPLRVAEELRFVAVGAGHDNSCAVTTEGATYCWGDARWGQLGDGGPIEDRVETAPVKVHTGETFRLVSLGSALACALNEDRRTYCWGNNLAGGVGQSPEAVGDECFGDPCSRRPVAVSGDNEFVSLSVGVHACGLTPEGRILCWGNNETGALGRGTVDTGIHPTPGPLVENLLFGRAEE